MMLESIYRSMYTCKTGGSRERLVACIDTSVPVLKSGMFSCMFVACVSPRNSDLMRDLDVS
jgi:hypothetical protein